MGRWPLQCVYEKGFHGRWGLEEGVNGIRWVMAVANVGFFQ
jgi:hypothetical protein